jgi:Domain of unknown function (DUF4249)
MKNYWLIILLSLYLVSCEKSGIIGENKPVLSLIGSISPYSGVQIHLTRTYPPEGNFYDKDTKWNIENANIELWEADKKVKTLVHQSNGRYKLPNDSWKPSVGTSYSIKATAVGFDPIESEKIIIPSFNGNIKHTYKYSKTGSYINVGKPLLEVNLSFQDDNTLNNAYHTSIYASKNGKNDSVNQVLDALPDIPSNNQALACGVFRVSNYDFCLKNNCFQGKYYTHKFGLETIHSNSKTNIDEEIDKIDIQISKVSIAWYNYLNKTHLNNVVDWEYREPYISYTNIKGGIGVFYGKNEYSFSIKL